MADNTFTLRDVNYKIGRIGGITQNDIARMIAVPLIRLGGIRKVAIDGGTAPPSITQQAHALCALSADVSTEAMAFVIGACLDVVTREMEGGRGWTPVRANGQMMFQDIDDPDAINQMVLRVIDVHRIVELFQDLPPVSAPPAGVAR